MARYHDAPVKIRRLVAVVVIVVVAVLSVQAHQRNPHDLGPVHRVALALTYPVEWLGGRIWGGVSGAWGGVAGIFGASKRAAELQRRVEHLEGEALRARALGLENHQLARLLMLRPMLPSTTLAARVLTRGTGARVRSFRIDRGERDGLRPGQVVVGSVGVVGQLVEVGERSGVVLELTDRRSSFAVRVGAEGLPALVVGDGDRGLRVEGVFEQHRDSLSLGDLLWTSGEDGLAPAGLGVARIERISQSPEGLFLRIEARPMEPTAALVVVQVLVD
jgi:rod shape-determining protein MreC